MKEQNLINIMWTGIGIFVSYFSINILAVVQWKWQQGFFDSPIEFFKNTERPSAWLIGMFIIIITSFAIFYLSNLYININQAQENQSNRSWYLKIPIAFNLDIEINSREANNNKVLCYYQLFFFISFLAFPFLISVQLLYKFFKENINVYSVAQPKNFVGTQLELMKHINLSLGHEYTLGSINGVTYYPFIMPIALLFIEFVLIVYVLIYIDNLIGWQSMIKIMSKLFKKLIRYLYTKVRSIFRN